MKWKLTFKYDGNKFYGFAKQPIFPTIQGRMEKLLSQIYNEKIEIVGASRTDKNVHAKNQCISYEAKKNISFFNIKTFIESNEKSFMIKNINRVDSSFNARKSVKNKTYEYLINIGEYNPFERKYVWQINNGNLLNISKLNEIKIIFIGNHNFLSFTAKEEYKNGVREIIDIEILVENSILIIRIVGVSFLRYMVRNIIGVMLEYSKGNLSKQEIVNFFEDPIVGSTNYKVPGCGLYLIDVKY